MPIRRTRFHLCLAAVILTAALILSFGCGGGGGTTVTTPPLPTAEIWRMAGIAVTWTLPRTFPITRVKLSAESFTGADNTGIDCNTDGPVLGITATTGAITIPGTCGGQPVLDVNLNVDIEGVNGERETIIGQFK